jgi:uncharacterized protein YjbJ (UPF0337 family)
MGAFDEAKGKVKEAAGSLSGSDDLRNEGQAQQQKGEHEDEAARLRAEANAAEGKADAAEDREQTHQGT